MSRARDLASNVTALGALAEIEAMLTARGVGTVSELNGVPTGSIVQSGSNANGFFVRYADGTQITSMQGVENRSTTGVVSTVMTQPVNFITSPQYNAFACVVGTAGTLANNQGIGVENRNASSVTVNINRSTTGNTTFQVFCYGRWY